MSDSRYCGYPREKTLKFFGKRTGWYGENCWAAEGRKFIKRVVKRSNRRFLNKEVQNYLKQATE